MKPGFTSNHHVWHTGDSDRLITASADQTVRIWELQTGKELFQFQQGEPCRSVQLSIGEQHMAYTTDAFMGTPPMVHIYKLEADISQQSRTPVLEFDAPKGRITRVMWADLNRTLITSHDYGMMRRWDVEVGPGCISPRLQTSKLGPAGLPQQRSDFCRGRIESHSSVHGLVCILG